MENRIKNFNFDNNVAKSTKKCRGIVDENLLFSLKKNKKGRNRPNLSSYCFPLTSTQYTTHNHSLHHQLKHVLQHQLVCHFE